MKTIHPIPPAGSEEALIRALETLLAQENPDEARLQALLDQLDRRALLPEGCRFLGVVKADAYGHGAVPVARKLEELGAELKVSRQTISKWETGVSHSYRYHTKHNNTTLIRDLAHPKRTYRNPP